MTIDYPEEWLQKYRPAFIADRDTMQQSMGLYAHRVQYDDSEYQYAYYWHKLTHQQGILFDADSHLGDHEPTIVRVDSDGVIDRVTYTFYHHLADSISGARLTRALRARETAEPTHVQLRIVPPWHNYAVVEGTPRSRCRSAMSKATPTPLTSGRGRRRASSTQRPMRQCGVPAPYRTEDRGGTSRRLTIRPRNCTCGSASTSTLRAQGKSIANPHMSNRTYGAWDRPPPPVPPPHDRTVSLANQPDSCTRCLTRIQIRRR